MIDSYCNFSLYSEAGNNLFASSIEWNDGNSVDDHNASAPVLSDPKTSHNNHENTYSSTTSKSHKTLPHGNTNSAVSHGNGWQRVIFDHIRLETGDEEAEELNRELDFTSARIWSSLTLVANLERVSYGYSIIVKSTRFVVNFLIISIQQRMQCCFDNEKE